MYCPHCGKEATTGTFCSHCGNKLEASPSDTIEPTTSPVGAPTPAEFQARLNSLDTEYAEKPRRTGLIVGIIVGAVVFVLIGVGVFAFRAGQDVAGSGLFSGSSANPAPGNYPELDALWEACDEGDYSACDDLFFEAPAESVYEDFGDSCGNRNEPAGYCVDIYGTGTSTTPSLGSDGYGSDAQLDALWDDCEAGDFEACDDLFFAADYGTEYSDFGDSCGNRNEPAGYCVDIYGTGSSGSSSTAGTYGSDIYLDLLWDLCEAGDYASCDDLYIEAPIGSEYEYFGDSCGYRNEPAGYCEDIYG